MNPFKIREEPSFVRRSWLLPDFAGSFPFDTVIASILATQGNLHSTNFIRFLKCVPYSIMSFFAL